MKTDFLKELGITEQSTIDAIMAQNGKDINHAKSQQTTLETKVTDLETQLADRDKQLEDLKASVGDNEELTKKISELEDANKNATTEYENKIANIQKTHAIENGVRDAKGKNVKAIMALLDIDKITHENGEVKGLSEQLKTLQEDETSSFLFGDVGGNPPAGTKPGDSQGGTGGTPPTGLSFSEAIAKSLGNTK